MKKRRKLRKKNFKEYVGKGLYFFIGLLIIANFIVMNNYRIGRYPDFEVFFYNLLWPNIFLLGSAIFTYSNYKKYLRGERDW